MRTSLLLLSLVAVRAFAAGPTFVVNSPADVPDALPGDGKCETTSPGVCTLRAAIEEANMTTEATIQLPSGTFTLSLMNLTVSASMTIVGAGAGSTTVSGNNLFKVFLVNGVHLSVSFQKITIQDGSQAGYAGAGLEFSGGGVGLVSLNDCVITHCFAQFGAAISSNSPLALTNTSITDCHANDASSDANGGALPREREPRCERERLRCLLPDQHPLCGRSGPELPGDLEKPPIIPM